MRVLVISDLHIRGNDDPLYVSLLKLLRDRTETGDVLVLAGDLFDLFVGNKKIFTARYAEFIQTLRQISERGVKVHYIEGNHDFLIRRAFAGVPGLEIWPHDVRIDLGGRRLFVAHGDTVDRNDIRYRVLRGFFRSPVMKALVAMIPGPWLDWIGRTSSQRSRASKPLLPAELPIDRKDYLRRVYRSFAAERLSEGYDFVVLGHSHDLDEMHFKIGNRTGQYVNVGYPRVHGSFLQWSPGEDSIRRVPL